MELMIMLLIQRQQRIDWLWCLTHALLDSQNVHSLNKCLGGGSFLTYVAKKLHYTFEGTDCVTEALTLKNMRHRHILGAGDTWKPPIWPLEPATHDVEADPSQLIADVLPAPATTLSVTPPAHPVAPPVPSSLEAKLDLLLACARTFADHFHIPHPVVPSPSPPILPTPSPVHSTLASDPILARPSPPTSHAPAQETACSTEEVEQTIGQALAIIQASLPVSGADTDEIVPERTIRQVAARIAAGLTSSGSTCEEEEADADLGISMDDIDAMFLEPPGGDAALETEVLVEVQPEEETADSSLSDDGDDSAAATESF